MMRHFEKLISEQPNITVLYTTPATHLITNVNGEVIGVRAEQGRPTHGR